MALEDFRKKLFMENRTVIFIGDKSVCDLSKTSFLNICKFMAVWFCDLFSNEIDIKYMVLVSLHDHIIFVAFDRSYGRPFCKMTR